MDDFEADMMIQVVAATDFFGRKVVKKALIEARGEPQRPLIFCLPSLNVMEGLICVADGP